MEVKKGMVLREVAGRTVVIPTGAASREFNGMVKLNDTGRLIWEGLAEGKSEEEIAASLTQKYQVSGEGALRDVRNFASKMTEAGFLQK